jgi:hypothetical protein
MEAASVPSTPAEGEPQAPAEPTQPQAPDAPQTPAAPDAPAQNGASPDLSEQIADLTKRLDSAGISGEPGGANLYDTLSGEQPEPEFTEQDLADLQAAGIDLASLGIDAPQQPQVDEYGYPLQQQDPMVSQLAAQVEAMTERELQREHQSIETEFPDIMEPKILEPLQAKLSVLAQQYGDAAATDPQLVREMYKAVKAEQADAGAVSAQEAGAEGAALETGAGRSQQGGADPSEAFADALASTGGGSVFTR